MKEKRSIGFHTPSKVIKDAFAIKQNEIEQSLGNWEWLAQRANEIFTKDMGEVDHKGLYAWLILNLIEIAQLGEELAKTRKDLASIEESMRHPEGTETKESR